MSNAPLLFDPDFELTFNDNTATLSVSSENSQSAVCMVQATAGKCYKISPSHFFVLPSVEVVVAIDFTENTDDDDRSDHQIIVQWLIIGGKDVTDNAENYWKQNRKIHSKEILSRNFECEFKEQNSLSVPDISIINTDNRMLHKANLDENIEHLAKVATESHTSLVQLNFEFTAVIKEIEATGAQQLKEIVGALHQIAISYKRLEQDARSTVKQTTNVLSEVVLAATSMTLQPSEKIELMKQDFDSLSEEFDKLAERHIVISAQLDTQAELAEAAKVENDRRVQKSEEMKERAQLYGILSVPGVGLASSIGACALGAVESVDQPALKVLTGFGGAIGGAFVGAVITVGSPVLLVIAAVLAVRSKVWSAKFEDMHVKIQKIQEIINMAGQYLSDISSDLNKLSSETKQVNEKHSNEVLNHAFGRMKRSCEKAIEDCARYEKLANASTKNMRRIDKSTSS